MKNICTVVFLMGNNHNHNIVCIFFLTIALPKLY